MRPNLARAVSDTIDVAQASNQVRPANTRCNMICAARKMTTSHAIFLDQAPPDAARMTSVEATRSSRVAAEV